jgi:hypothetical protein
VAFLRFTRDKRGYEQFSLVEASTNRRGKTRSRLLYWYRTPPNVKVGREPFDESVRRALEAQYPGVQFDWRKIVETPIPSAETERWRERRRAEKAEKVARRSTSVDQEAESDAENESDGEVEEAALPIEDGRIPADASETATAAVDTPPQVKEQPAGQPRGRRRRRRGGRGRQQGEPALAAAGTPLGSDADAASDGESDHQPESRSASAADLEPTSEPEGE